MCLPFIGPWEPEGFGGGSTAGAVWQGQYSRGKCPAGHLQYEHLRLMDVSHVGTYSISSLTVSSQARPLLTHCLCKLQRSPTCQTCVSAVLIS